MTNGVGLGVVVGVGVGVTTIAVAMAWICVELSVESEFIEETLVIEFCICNADLPGLLVNSRVLWQPAQ